MSWQYGFCETVGGELGVKLKEKAMMGVAKELIDIEQLKYLIGRHTTN